MSEKVPSRGIHIAWSASLSASQNFYKTDTPPSTPATLFKSIIGSPLGTPFSNLTMCAENFDDGFSSGYIKPHCATKSPRPFGLLVLRA